MFIFIIYLKYYKKNNIDITTLLPAEGQIRDVQLATLSLLKDFDTICKQNDIRYWLDGGTLLGAIRHKGFVPWDDDIDTAMLREDYEQIIEAFEKYSRNPDIFVGHRYCPNKYNNYHLKVQHRKCPYIFVDIFPWDTYGKRLSIADQLEKTIEKFEKAQDDFDSYVDTLESYKDFMQLIGDNKALTESLNAINDINK